MNKTDEKTLALAAIAQACLQVSKIANTGLYDSDILITAIYSILNTAPKSTEDVYGKKSSLRSGLRIITQYSFSNTKTNTSSHQDKINDVVITKYIISLLSLSGKLLKNDPMLEKISTGIENAKKQKQQLEFLNPDDNSLDNTNLIANLAGLYQGTISTLSPRIMVQGNSTFLEQPDKANRIRTLLLSGIRSGILWHQLGGSRWQLLFQRRKIIASAKDLLKI